MKNVTVITTGGTIATKVDSETGKLVPAVTGNDLVMGIPQLANVANVDVVEFSNVSSAQITPQIVKKLGDLIESILETDVHGVVITHGTDTLEETAFFLNLYVRSDKPVCVVGAMRGASDLCADGSKNILDAIRVAADSCACGLGTLVVMNEEIHSATTVTKTSTGNVDTFKSPTFGACGYVDSDKIVIYSRPVILPKLHPTNIDENVPIVKVYTAMDSSIFDYFATTNIKGIVIEGFGRGNIPANLVGSIAKLIEKGIIVVVASRVISGRVLDVYGYAGSTTDLVNNGVILSNGLNAQKARLKLILSLGLTNEKCDIQKIFDN